MSIFQKKPCELAREVALVLEQQRAMQALRSHGFSSWLFGVTQEELQQATSEELQQASHKQFPERVANGLAQTGRRGREAMKLSRMCFEWKVQDAWIGAYWKRKRYALHIWICVVPLHLVFV